MRKGQEANFNSQIVVLMHCNDYLKHRSMQRNTKLGTGQQRGKEGEMEGEREMAFILLPQADEELKQD